MDDRICIPLNFVVPEGFEYIGYRVPGDGNDA